MKFWKSQWKKELEDSLPKNCSAVSQQVEQNGEQLSHVLTKRRNWIITAISLALALMIALAVGLSLIKPTNTLRVFALEINPSAVFVVDQKGVITNASSVNFDADVILSDDERRSQIVGKTVKDGVNAFIEYAIQLGYMDVTNDSMKVTGVNEFINTVKESAKAYLTQKGANVEVLQSKKTTQEFGNYFGIDFKNEQEIFDKIKELPILYSDKCANDKGLEELANEYMAQVNEYIRKHLKYEFSNLDISPELKQTLEGFLDEEEFILYIEGMIQEGHLPNDIIPLEMKELLQKPEFASKEEFKNKMQNLTNKVYEDFHGKHKNPNPNNNAK